MDLRFDDHVSFHRAAAGMVGGSILIGAALSPVTPIASLVGGVAGIGLGAAWAYGHAKLRLVAAALAIGPLVVLSTHAAGFALVAAFVALGLAAGGPRGVRGALGVGIAMLAVLVALWCAVRFANARETAGWPLILQSALGAGAMGIVGVLAMLPRHVGLARDPVLVAVRALPRELDPEVRALCDRAVAIWRSMKDRDDAENTTLAREGVVKTLEVAAKSAPTRIVVGSEAELDERIAALDGRIEATADADAKAQYQAARSALEDQRRYHQRLSTGRERLIARMHNHVAALEKFQLAAGHCATRDS